MALDKVSGELHVPGALPSEKTPIYLSNRTLVGTQSRAGCFGEENIYWPFWNSNSESPSLLAYESQIVQPVASLCPLHFRYGLWRRKFDTEVHENWLKFSEFSIREEGWGCLRELIQLVYSLQEGKQITIQIFSMLLCVAAHHRTLDTSVTSCENLTPRIVRRLTVIECIRKVAMHLGYDT
jgi:hypothetical protein